MIRWIAGLGRNLQDDEYRWRLAMVLSGHFENGLIVLDEPRSIPNGTAVRVEVLVREKTTGEENRLDIYRNGDSHSDSKTPPSASCVEHSDEVRGQNEPNTESAIDNDAKPRKTLLEIFANVAGKADWLPPDASINVDHYLYGHPKK